MRRHRAITRRPFQNTWRKDEVLLGQGAVAIMDEEVRTRGRAAQARDISRLAKELKDAHLRPSMWMQPLPFNPRARRVARATIGSIWGKLLHIPGLFHQLTLKPTIPQHHRRRVRVPVDHHRRGQFGTSISHSGKEVVISPLKA